MNSAANTLKTCLIKLLYPVTDCGDIIVFFLFDTVYHLLDAMSVTHIAHTAIKRVFNTNGIWQMRR